MFSSLMVFSAILVQQRLQRGRYLDKLTAGATFIQFSFTKTVPNFENIHLSHLFIHFSRILVAFQYSNTRFLLEKLKSITRPKTNFQIEDLLPRLTTCSRRLTSSQMRTVFWPFSQFKCGKNFLPSLVMVKFHLLNCFSKSS